MDFWGDWLIAMRLSGKNGGDKNENTVHAQTQQISRAETKKQTRFAVKNSIFGTPKEQQPKQKEKQTNWWKILLFYLRPFQCHMPLVIYCIFSVCARLS